MQTSNKAERLRLGLGVFIGLIVLTAVEFGLVIWIGRNVVPYLAVIALFKAGLIAQYFMHIAQLWYGEE
ncbi:MAG: cytochrome C oxidase subunit IV family protein [Anaerolineae bacterium]|jgi:hypothetical protein